MEITNADLEVCKKSFVPEGARNIVDSQLCSCGIFICKKYSYARLDKLLNLNVLVFIDTHLVLWGDNTE